MIRLNNPISYYLPTPWLNSFPLELRFVQLRIQPIQGDQLLVRASFHDLTSIHHQD